MGGTLSTRANTCTLALEIKSFCSLRYQLLIELIKSLIALELQKLC